MEYPKELEALEKEYEGRRLPRQVIWNKAVQVTEEKHKKPETNET